MFTIQPYASYNYNDRFTLIITEPYTDNDFVNYEVHMIQLTPDMTTRQFVPSSETLKQTIVNQNISHIEIKELPKLKEWSVIVRINKTSGYEDFGPIHAVTCDENELAIIHEPDNYGAWGQFADNERGNIHCYVVPVYGHGIAGTQPNFHYVASSYGYVPFFKVKKVFSRDNITAQQKAYDPDGNKNPVLFFLKTDGIHYVFSDDIEGTVWDYSKSRLILPHTSDLQQWATVGGPIELSDGSWLLSLGRRNYTVYPSSNRVTDALCCRVSFDVDGNLVADEPVVVKNSDKKYYGYYGGSLAKICYLDKNGEIDNTDPRNFYPNEHIVGIMRTNELEYGTNGSVPQGGMISGNIPMQISYDSGRTWTTPIANLPVTGWSTPIILFDKQRKRLWLYICNRINYDPTKTSAGSYLFWNDTFSADGWSGIQITEDSGVNMSSVNAPSLQNDYGEGTITIILEKDEIWMTYYRTVGIPTSQDGTSNPYQAFKILDISTNVPIEKQMPKFSYETDPYRMGYYETEVIPDNQMPFGLSSAKTIHKNIILPMYSDALLTTPDNSLGNIILNQSNTVTKYIKNHTPVEANVILKLIINERLSDGTLVPHTFLSDSQTLQPGEAKSFQLAIGLTGIYDVEKDGNNNPVCYISPIVRMVN